MSQNFIIYKKNQHNQSTAPKNSQQQNFLFNAVPVPNISPNITTINPQQEVKQNLTSDEDKTTAHCFPHKPQYNIVPNIEIKSSERRTSNTQDDDENQLDSDQEQVRNDITAPLIKPKTGKLIQPQITVKKNTNNNILNKNKGKQNNTFHQCINNEKKTQQACYSPFFPQGKKKINNDSLNKKINKKYKCYCINGSSMNKIQNDKIIIVSLQNSVTFKFSNSEKKITTSFNENTSINEMKAFVSGYNMPLNKIILKHNDKIINCKKFKDIDDFENGDVIEVCYNDISSKNSDSNIYHLPDDFLESPSYSKLEDKEYTKYETVFVQDIATENRSEYPIEERNIEEFCIYLNKVLNIEDNKFVSLFAFRTMDLVLLWNGQEAVNDILNEIDDKIIYMKVVEKSDRKLRDNYLRNIQKLFPHNILSVDEMNDIFRKAKSIQDTISTIEFYNFKK